jgi:hypothetical protein
MGVAAALLPGRLPCTPRTCQTNRKSPQSGVSAPDLLELGVSEVVACPGGASNGARIPISRGTREVPTSLPFVIDWGWMAPMRGSGRPSHRLPAWARADAQSWLTRRRIDIQLVNETADDPIDLEPSPRARRLVF